MIVEVSGTAREDEPGSPLNIRFYYTHAGHARCCRLSAQALLDFPTWLRPLKPPLQGTLDFGGGYNSRTRRNSKTKSFTPFLKL